MGLGGLLFIYGVANIAMVTGVIPVMGVPLPFVSYGGSALVTNLAAVGLIRLPDVYMRSHAAGKAAVSPRSANASSNSTQHRTGEGLQLAIRRVKVRHRDALARR